MKRLALLTVLSVLAVAQPAMADQPVRDLAGKIVAHGVVVNCIAMPNGDQGRTYENADNTFEPLIDLSRATCSELAALVRHRSSSRAAGANALETLLHEAHHLSLQNPDEGVVECAALRAMRFWLNRIGYHASDATRLIRLAWDAHLKLPPQYQACDPPFPTIIIDGISIAPVERPS